MSILYAISVWRKDNGTADIGYGVGFIVAVSVAAAFAGLTWATSILAGMVYVWGSRLAIRIFLKNRGKQEDFRYRAWREAWGSRFLMRSFLQIYMLQGAVIFTVVLPVLLAIISPVQIQAPFFWLGVCLWVVGFVFEAVADFQLDSFIAAPLNKGRIMQSGLWRYSRHPNYFGESLMWWGMAISAAGMSAYPLVGFISPALITFLLLKVSGVPLLEKRWEGNPAWEEYKKRTSVFIPMMPKA